MQQVGNPARAVRANAFALINGTITIPLDDVAFDPGGAQDTSHFFGGSSPQLTTNGGKFICPVAGYYLVTAQVAVSATAAGQVLEAIIGLNGATYAEGCLLQSQAAGNLRSNVCDIVEASAGNDIDLRAFCSAALNMAVATLNDNYMSVVLLA